MCYYARTDYDCSDWKWGNMMLRCPRQHRIGETCGAKLVHSESVTKGGALCKICEEIEIKKRRYSKTCDNISRWEREPDKFSASLEKAKREASELREKIKDLHYRRPSVASNLNLQASSPPPVTNSLPPMTMSTTTQGYEYVSPQAHTNRRQEHNSQHMMRTTTVSQTTPVMMTTYSQMPTLAQQQGATYPRMSMRPAAQQTTSPTGYYMDRR